MKFALEHLTVAIGTPIRTVMECIQRNARGIALVLDDETRLLATITDGDIRGAILRGTELGRPISEVVAYQAGLPGPHPITAPLSTPRDELRRLMMHHRIRHVPLVDGDGRVGAIAQLSELVEEEELQLNAVVMAGGLGTRLRPLTQNLPKPMLPVGDKPLMERIVEQLKSAGIRQVNVTTHYKPEAILDHFGDGERFGIDMYYVHEEQPLGTAGSLRLVSESDEPLLVVNGDILTQMNFRAMFDYHRHHHADLTVGVRQFEINVPYGVIRSERGRIVAVDEKPTENVFINAGVYLLEPAMRRFIPAGRRFDMTDLIERLVAEGKQVVSFPIHEFWLDIGQPGDYASANEEYAR